MGIAQKIKVLVNAVQSHTVSEFNSRQGTKVNYKTLEEGWIIHSQNVVKVTRERGTPFQLVHDIKIPPPQTI